MFQLYITKFEELHVKCRVFTKCITTRLLPVTTGFSAEQDWKLENREHPESNVLQGTAEPFQHHWRLAASMCTVHLYSSNSASHKKPCSTFNPQRAFKHPFHFLKIQFLKSNALQDIKNESNIPFTPKPLIARVLVHQTDIKVNIQSLCQHLNYDGKHCFHL